MSSNRYHVEEDIELKRAAIYIRVEQEATRRVELQLEYDLLKARERTKQLTLELELEKEKVKRLVLEKGS